MKTFVATLIVSSFALTGGAFAEKTNNAENNAEVSSTNSKSAVTNSDLYALFNEPGE